MSEETPETRMKLALQLWNLLENRSLVDIHHFNALLDVRIENKQLFSLKETLADIKSRNLEPNELTFKALVGNYCRVGDLDGVEKTLVASKERGFDLEENSYNWLILAHGFGGLVNREHDAET